MDKKLLHFKKEKGQSLVELALSFLLLMLILGGVFDLGSMFYTYLALRDTAQEGVIYGSYNPTKTTGINDRIHASANWPIDADQISNIDVFCCSKSTPGACTFTTSGACSTTVNTSCQGQKITVEVIYNYKFNMPLFGGVIPLNATVTNTILESKDTISALKSLPTPQFCQ